MEHEIESEGAKGSARCLQVRSSIESEWNGLSTLPELSGDIEIFDAGGSKVLIEASTEFNL